MPELPEVEVLVRYLAPQVVGQTIRRIRVLDARSLRGPSPERFKRKLRNSLFTSVRRRGKYLIFGLQHGTKRFSLIGHLGMTGRMHIRPHGAPFSPHTTIGLNLGDVELLFEDPRRFGGFTFDSKVIDRLGPEPLDKSFTIALFRTALGGSRQAIKVRLLDQGLIAGVGNIYASEALFLAQLHPATPCCQLNDSDIRRLRTCIRRTLREAIRFGSSLPLYFASHTKSDGLFYFGSAPTESKSAVERFHVYDRDGMPCPRCGKPIERMRQATRSTYYCPRCQPKRRRQELASSFHLDRLLDKNCRSKSHPHRPQRSQPKGLRI